MTRFIFLIGLMFLLFTSCDKQKNSQDNNESNKQKTHPLSASPAQDEGSDLNALASKAIISLKEKNFSLLSELAWKEGVRFSPYGYVNVKQDKVWTKDSLKYFWKDTSRYFWGHYDGSGEEIILTPQLYYKKFIYERDFAAAPKTAVDSALGTGNSLLNYKDVYPGAHFIEYYFPGTDPSYGGMDWSSLRLFFRLVDGRFVLIGIVHDQWTS